MITLTVRKELPVAAIFPEIFYHIVQTTAVVTIRYTALQKKNTEN